MKRIAILCLVGDKKRCFMCISPVTIRHPSTGQVVTFPCGKCVECIQKYQNDWTFRLECEYMQWNYAYFITMTYSNDNIPYVELSPPVSCSLSDDGLDSHPVVTEHPEVLDYVRDYFAHMPLNRHLSRLRDNLTVCSAYVHPDNIEVGIPVPTVCKSDVQSWLKRLREQYAFEHDGDRLEFKYFICSEYGPSTFRPHYHAIIFCDLSVRDFNKYFVYPWRDTYGNVKWKFRPIKFRARNGVGDVMAYVAKYCSKPSFAENPYVNCHIIEKPFRLISKGVGIIYMKRLYEFLADFDGCKFFRIPNCRYSLEYRYSSKFGVYWMPQMIRDWSYGCTKSYCEHLNRCFTTLRNGFLFRIPRYYIDKTFPQRYYYTDYYDEKTKTFRRRRCLRKDADSTVWLTYKNFVQNQISEFLRQSIRSIASTLGCPDDMEVFHTAEVMYEQARMERYKAKARKLYDFYAKGLKYEL